MPLRKAYILKSSPDNRRHICIDAINEEDILKFLNEEEARVKKFKQICNLILDGFRNSELYGKENINEDSKGVTAMKMFKGGQNIRIYCKELKVNNANFYVIVSELLPKKKDQKVKGKVKSLIKTVANYEYVIQERG